MTGSRYLTEIFIDGRLRFAPVFPTAHEAWCEAFQAAYGYRGYAAHRVTASWRALAPGERVPEVHDAHNMRIGGAR